MAAEKPSAGPLEQDELAELGEFSRECFPERPAGPSFLRWLYLDLPGSKTYVAREGTRVVAISAAFHRHYAWGGETCVVREPFDFFALPGPLSGGYLFSVSRAHTSTEPCLAVGGSEAFLKNAKRIGFREVGEARSYLLPLHSEVAADLAERKLPALPAPARALASKVATRLYWGPSAFSLRRRQGRLIPTNSVEGIARLYLESDVSAQLPDQGSLDWLAKCRHPADSQFLPFRCEDSAGNLVGWALLRVLRTNAGIQGEIVEVFSRDLSAYEWIVPVIVRILQGYAVSLIRCRASCPALGAALRRTRFLAGDPLPILYTGDNRPRGRVHVCRNTADVPIRPYA